MYNYNKTQDSPHDPTKLAIHCVLRPKVNLASFFDLSLEKTLSFDDLMHFSEEEKIVASVNFDCGFSLYHEFPKKANRSTENGKKFPDAVETPSASQVMINIAVLLMTSIPSTSFGTRAIYET